MQKIAFRTTKVKKQTNNVNDNQIEINQDSQRLQPINPQNVNHKVRQNQLNLQKAYLSSIVNGGGQALYLNTKRKITIKATHRNFNREAHHLLSERDNYIKTLQPNQFTNTINTFRISKGVKFPKAIRYLSQINYRSNDPSPSQYKHEFYEKNRNSPKFTFPKQEKFFKTRRQMKCKTQIPGPNQYKINILEKKLMLTIPQSQRVMVPELKDSPGVGMYNIQKQYLKNRVSIKFPQNERKFNTNDEITPAPNQYFNESANQFRNKQQSFGKSKKLQLKLLHTPGVGEYSIDLFRPKNSPNARFPTQGSKDKRYQFSEEKLPGPGEYNSCSIQKYKGKTSSNAIFNRALKRKDEKTDYPGPGKYNISQKRIKYKGGLLSSRLVSEQTEQVPGPSNYSPNIDCVATKSISARIGKAQKWKRLKQLSPGPHDYHPQGAKIQLNSTGFAFPKGRRQFV